MILINGNTPWRLEPLKGKKYYGTVIVDREGREMLRVWGHRQGDDLNPSLRQQAEWHFDDVELCDTHYETVTDLFIATELMKAVNDSVISDDKNDGLDSAEELVELALIAQYLERKVKRLEGLREVLSFHDHRVVALRKLTRMKALLSFVHGLLGAPNDPAIEAKLGGLER